MRPFLEQLMTKHTAWQRIERVIFLVALIVAALDLYYWRP